MNFPVKLTEPAPINIIVDFAENTQNLDADFEVVQTVSPSTLPAYAGEYEISPKFFDQTLLTRGKAMRDDVTIRSIPVYRVSNTSGGTTVYIANEV